MPSHFIETEILLFLIIRIQAEIMERRSQTFFFSAEESPDLIRKNPMNNN